MGKSIDLTGKRFGRLIVIRQIGVDKRRREKTWLCQCDCGNTKETKTSYLTSGDTSSCGCYRRECELKNLEKCRGIVQKKHGRSNTRIYQIWADMKDRCNNRNNKAFKNYGGRGIKVCEEWEKDFMTFYTWAMDNGYKDTLTIDRINVNKNYEASNCRWVTWEIQANNKRTTKKIKIYEETKTAKKKKKIYGIKASLLLERYNKGYRDDKLVYKGSLRHFQKTDLKRDSKGRYLKKEEQFQSKEKL